MRRNGKAGWSWMVVLGTVGVAAGASPPLPPDFSFPRAGNSPGVVSFSHQKHADPKVNNCLNCHASGKFMIQKGGTEGITMAALNMGKFCGECHNGTRAFSTKDPASCAKCHKAG